MRNKFIGSAILAFLGSFSLFILSTSIAEAQTSPPTANTLELLKNLYYTDPAVQQVLLFLLFVAAVLGLFSALALLIVLVVVSIFVEPKNFSRYEVMHNSWLQTKKHFWVLASFVLIQIIVLNLPTFLFPKMFGSLYASSSWLRNLALVVQFALLLYTQAGFVNVSFRIIDGKTLSFVHFFVGGFKYVKFASAGILHVFVSTVGLFLLLLPGVAWYTRFFLWPYIVIDKNASPIAALRESSVLTFHKRKDVFLFIVFISAVNLLGVLALLVGAFVAIPLTSIALARLYRVLAEQAGKQTGKL
ncbi:hypothetical protein HY622_00020 [Candidatus Uhrbacteria bacterium]|nr:hypothetical protein [Candidatus Uhrbacteria bacterium]